MTISLKPEQERIIQAQIASGRFRSVDEVLDTALSNLPNGGQADLAARRSAVQRMIAFGERHRLNFGEPISRKLFHEGHRA